MEYPKRSRLASLAWKEVIGVPFLGRPFEDFHRDLKRVQAKWEKKLSHDPPSAHTLQRNIYWHLILLAMSKNVPFEVIEADLQAWIDIGFGDPVKEALTLYMVIRKYRDQIGKKETNRIYKRLKTLIEEYDLHLRYTMELMAKHGAP